MQLKKKLIGRSLLAFLALAIALPSMAHNRTPSITYAPAIDRYEIDDRHVDDRELVVIDRATLRHFDDVSRIELPAEPIASQLETRIRSITLTTDHASIDVFPVRQKLASGSLELFDENNLKERRELGLKTRWAIGNARARWYDPSTGTFLSPDPMGYADSSNLYAFAGGDPVNNSDPTGLCLGFGEGTCADWANAGKKKLDKVRQFVDKHTGSTIVDVGVNAQIGVALDAVDAFVLDPFRFGDATGDAIGSGAGGVQTTLAVVQDIGRGAALAAGAGTVLKATGKVARAAQPLAQRAIGAYSRSILSSETGAVGGGVRNIPRVTTSLAETRFATADELGAEAYSRYQRYVDEAYEAALRAEARGRLEIPETLSRETVIGQKVDRAARLRMKRWLRSEGINEGPGSIIEVNRWLRDPAGTGAYRIPDLRIPGSGSIMDATIGQKSFSLLQVQEFHSFSLGNRITIVRPTQLGGSYSLLAPWLFP